MNSVGPVNRWLLVALVAVLGTYVAMEMLPEARRLLPAPVGDRRIAGGIDGRVLVQPSTQVSMATHYLRCGHSEAESLSKPPELMNGLDAESLRRLYPDWKLSEFTPRSLALVRALPGMCPDCSRYRTIGIRDGRVMVFFGSGKMPGALVSQDTMILVTTLPKTDREQLEKGIVLNSDQEVADWLEGLTE